jgi:hypothetical protein
LVACPGSEDDWQGKWLKKKMAVAGMAVGLQDFGLAIQYLRAFMGVQRWCEGVEKQMKEEEGDEGQGR